MADLQNKYGGGWIGMESTGRWSNGLGSLNPKCHYEYQEIYPTLDPPLYLFIPVVLNLSSIELKGFVESVSGVRQRYIILRLFSTIPFFFNSCFVGFVL